MSEVLNLVIQHKATNDAWEISGLTKTVKWETHLRGQPGKLTVELNAAFNQDDVVVSAGDVLYFEVNGTRIFWGFIFTLTNNRYGEKTLTAFDQVRYLSKTRMSDIFTGMSTDAIVRRVADRMNLNTGALEKGGFVHDNWIHDDSNILDIIDESCALTYQSEKQILVFYSDGHGLLRLSSPPNVFPDYQKYVIGTGSLAQDYEYKQDIDANTFNSIVVEKPDPPKGTKTSVGSHDYTYLPPREDAKTVAQWGTLQKVIQVQKNMSATDMAKEAAAYLAAYNHPLETLSFKTFGVVGVRAGCLLPIYIPEPELNFVEMLMDTVTHEWTNNDHQMSLEMRVML